MCTDHVYRHVRRHVYRNCIQTMHTDMCTDTYTDVYHTRRPFLELVAAAWGRANGMELSDGMEPSERDGYLNASSLAIQNRPSSGSSTYLLL